MTSVSTPITLYAFAGVLTAPHFLNGFVSGLLSRIHAEAEPEASCALYPYGDWGRSALKQLAEISLDVCGSKIGGKRMVRQITELDGTRRVLLAGHSGGGVAAVHAAYLLTKVHSFTVTGVVMIGSPRIPIPKPLIDRVLFLYAAASEGKQPADPVTRLGRWGKRAPGEIRGIPLIGGHRDYFRSSPEFTDSRGRTNLDRTIDAVWTWLEPRL